MKREGALWRAIFASRAPLPPLRDLSVEVGIFASALTYVRLCFGNGYTNLSVLAFCIKQRVLGLAVRLCISLDEEFATYPRGIGLILGNFNLGIPVVAELGGLTCCYCHTYAILSLAVGAVTGEVVGLSLLNDRSLILGIGCLFSRLIPGGYSPEKMATRPSGPSPLTTWI